MASGSAGNASSASVAVKVAESSALAQDGDRIHVEVSGRFVSVIRHAGHLYCLDSTCYHTGGPLTVGDIEDVNGEPCVVCPWHMYQISLADGGKYYQPLLMGADRKMVPGAWTKKAGAQRTHQAHARADGVYVALDVEGKRDSDHYASSALCGQRNSSQNKPVHSKRSFGLPQRSGHVLGKDNAVPSAPSSAVPSSAVPSSSVSTGLAALSTPSGFSEMEEEEELSDETAAWLELTVASVRSDGDAGVCLCLRASGPAVARELLLLPQLPQEEAVEAVAAPVALATTQDLFRTRHLEVGLVVDGALEQRPYTPVKSARRMEVVGVAAGAGAGTGAGAGAEQGAGPLFELRVRLYEGAMLGPRLARLVPGDVVLASPGTTAPAPQLSMSPSPLPRLGELERVFLFAGGSGITPMLQIVQNVADRDVGAGAGGPVAVVAVTVVVANKSRARGIGLDALEALAVESASAPSTTVRVVHVLTNKDDDEGKGKRVDDPEFLASLGVGKPNAVYAWCGPAGFAEALRRTLTTKLGVDDSVCVPFQG